MAWLLRWPSRFRSTRTHARPHRHHPLTTPRRRAWNVREQVAEIYKQHGEKLKKRTLVIIKCKTGKGEKPTYVFQAFDLNEVQIGGVCRSVDKIAELIGGGPAAAIKK